MTDRTTQPTNTTIPQRAARASEGAGAPLPPMPEHDAFEGSEATARPTQEPHVNAADVADREIATDRDFQGEDPYADLDRPQGFVRQPFGEARLKLQAPARPGYRRYWFNDNPGRIGDALAAGYSFAKVNGRNTRNVVGRARNGGALVAYLMEIPNDWFAQDMRRQQTKVDEIDAAIKGGSLGPERGKHTAEGDNRYVPKEGIRYEPQRAARND